MEPMHGRAAVWNNIIFINNLQDAEEQEQRPPRRMFKFLDAFQLSGSKFVKLFRLSKELTQTLIDMVTPYMQAPTRASAINIEIKVLVALRFYATGSYQEIVGSNLFSAISQPSASRCITEVTDVLTRREILDEWVKFPRNIQEMENVRIRFYEKYEFPRVVGLIDCTHVAIASPSGQEYPENIYINRKNYHSINVQLVCDENLLILNVDARFPGSCNDAHIWKQSSVSRIMEQLHRQNPINLFYLLGDSGYTLRPWLLTPLDSPPNTVAEERFNSKLKTVRCGIERCNGVLKNRFRCLLKYRVLHYTPNRASKIINACCVLHNMCLKANIPEPDLDIDVELTDFGIYYEQFVEQVQQNRVNPDLVLARRIQSYSSKSFQLIWFTYFKRMSIKHSIILCSIK